MTTNSVIYCIKNKVNGHRYIGSTIDFGKRIDGHLKLLRKGKHHSRHLQFAYNVYGETAFDYYPLLNCETTDLVVYEQDAIDFFHPEYNMCPNAGGTRGYSPTEETRQKLSASHKGKQTWITKGTKLSDQHRASLRAAFKGRIITQEVREKISAAKSGMVFSDEHKRKLSEAKKGVPRGATSEETRRKISETKRLRNKQRREERSES